MILDRFTRKRATYSMQAAEIQITVTRKDVKRLILAVSAQGAVRISAPLAASRRVITEFALSRLEWIKKQIAAIQTVENTESVQDGARRYFWGRQLILRLHPHSGRNSIEADEGALHVYMRSNPADAVLAKLISAWEAQNVHKAALLLLDKWSDAVSAPPVMLSVRKMKSRWGSCTPMRKKITLNSELAKKEPQFLEYVLVHELAHFQHADHGPGFKALMDQLMPDWREKRRLLNRGR